MMGKHPYFETEHHRLNLQVCRVIGAQAAIDRALERARSVQSMPKWMIRYLENAQERLPGISTDLVAMRDAAPDSPHAADAWERRAREEAIREGLDEAMAYGCGKTRWSSTLGPGNDFSDERMESLRREYERILTRAAFQHFERLMETRSDEEGCGAVMAELKHVVAWRNEY